MSEGYYRPVVYGTLHEARQCHTTRDWLIGIGALVGSALLGYYIGVQLTKRRARVNHKIKLSTDKVADTIDLEDIGDKKAYCRCWTSNTWPFCDGSHNKHNQLTGDNVGPIVIKKAGK